MKCRCRYDFDFRYKLILLEVAKKLAKEIRAKGSNWYLRKFLISCDKAVDCMHEVNNFINRSLKDTDYRSSVRKLSDRISNMDVSEIKSLDTKHGRMLIEGQMYFKRETEKYFSGKCYVVFFQRCIISFEIEKEIKHRMKSWFGAVGANDTTKDTYKYICTIPITNNMEIQSDKQASGFMLTVSNMRNFRPDPHESFSIRLKDEKAYDELKEKIAKLINNAAPNPTEYHQRCNFQPFIKHHDMDIADPKPPPKCAACRHFLFGQLLFGYKCNTCRAIYHEKCFLAEEEYSVYGNISNFVLGGFEDRFSYLIFH